MRKGDRHHKVTGIRTKFKKLLDNRHFKFPSTTRSLSRKDEYGNPVTRALLTHPAKWYLDPERVRRPLTFAYAEALFAEHCLALSRQRNRGVVLATDLFADTRRLLQYILCNVRADKRLRGKQAEAMLPRLQALQQKARDVWKLLHKNSPLTPQSEI